MPLKACSSNQVVPHAAHNPSPHTPKQPMQDAVVGDGAVQHMSLDTSGDRVACYLRRGPISLLNTQLAKTSSFTSADSSACDSLWEEVGCLQWQCGLPTGCDWLEYWCSNGTAGLN